MLFGTQYCVFSHFFTDDSKQNIWKSDMTNGGKFLSQILPPEMHVWIMLQEGNRKLIVVAVLLPTSR